MSYASIVEMATNTSLHNRVQACAAEQNVPDPVSWTSTNMWALAASPGWATKWDTAKDSFNENQNPDFGERSDVISDGDILAAVQAKLT